jgi:hypothetical protein
LQLPAEFLVRARNTHRIHRNQPQSTCYLRIRKDGSTQKVCSDQNQRRSVLSQFGDEVLDVIKYLPPNLPVGPQEMGVINDEQSDPMITNRAGHSGRKHSSWSDGIDPHEVKDLLIEGFDLRSGLRMLAGVGPWGALVIWLHPVVFAG